VKIIPPALARSSQAKVLWTSFVKRQKQETGSKQLQEACHKAIPVFVSWRIRLEIKHTVVHQLINSTLTEINKGSSALRREDDGLLERGLPNRIKCLAGVRSFQVSAAAGVPPCHSLL
jgi:hypothetical protein